MASPVSLPRRPSQLFPPAARTSSSATAPQPATASRWHSRPGDSLIWRRSTPVWLAIWHIWAGFANSQLLPDAAALSSMQGLPWSGNSSAQTFASLHPPAALRLRVLPFTRTWSSTVCAEEFPTPLEMSPWIASAQTDANLSAHLHRLPTPPPYLRQMRLSPGRGAGIRWVIRLSLGRDAGVWCWI